MKFTPALGLFAAISLVAVSGCAHEPPPPIGSAVVNVAHASLRSKNSSTSKTLKVLEPGDRVELLERADRWFRVRRGEVEGWMEISTILTDDVQKKIQATVDAASSQSPQNTGTLTQDGNLRLEPGRSTAILRRMPAQTAVDVLERRTLPREDLPGKDDMWLKIRTPKDVGWLLSGFVEFDVPDEIERYTEDFIYSAVKVVNEIEDPATGTIRWYLVGERKPGTDPHLDFTGIRLFTWNGPKQRYETAFRLKGLRGVYPLEVSRQDGKPRFSVHELAPDGTAGLTRDFVMNGVLVREVRK